MPSYKNPAHLIAAGLTFTVHPDVPKHLPEAKGFLEGLLRRGISPPVAINYVKMVARLKRQGRLVDRDLLTHNVERSAANAYVKWRSENYGVRLTPVQAVLPQLSNKDAVRWLRRHAFVPPFEGKKIPRPVLGSVGEIAWVDSFACTLHVPETPVPAHVDPCATCKAIELSDEQLGAIALAFEQAWGHRDLSAVPADCYLFGEPPPEAAMAKTAAPAERSVALIGPGATAEALLGVNARVTKDVPAFVDRLREGADGVYLSREACAGRLGEILEAVRLSWAS